MEDIAIVSSRIGKSVVGPLTDRGETWIRKNMSIITGNVTIMINNEAVDEITRLIEADGLSVVVR